MRLALDGQWLTGKRASVPSGAEAQLLAKGEPRRSKEKSSHEDTKA